ELSPGRVFEPWEQPQQIIPSRGAVTLFIRKNCTNNRSSGKSSKEMFKGVIYFAAPQLFENLCPTPRARRLAHVLALISAPKLIPFVRPQSLLQQSRESRPIVLLA